MKLTNYTFLFIILICTCFFTSCLEDDCAETRTFVQIEPVFIELSEIRKDPTTTEARELENPGKLYFYQNMIFINELKEGIHIIDNTDSKNPKNLGFINIPGNVDVAIQDGYLYADSYMDLITLDIRDTDNISLTCRHEDIFQSQFSFQDNRGFLVDYVETENSIEVDCSETDFANTFINRGGEIFVDVAFDAAGPTGPQGAPGPQGSTAESGGGTGTGGSLARFSIAKNHLYVIDAFNLFVYDIAKADKPVGVNEQYIEWGIETLFPYRDLLFIGANNGMFIYNNENPKEPFFLSKFEHARACDPVFVQGDIAYVTLRDGTRCESFSNQLDVVDVADWRNPKLLETHEMDNPHGLSIRGDHLYLCEGEYGLKVFDKTDITRIPDEQTDHINNIHAFDVISLSENHLLVIGLDGLYQYDSSDKDNLEEISVISVTRGN